MVKVCPEILTWVGASPVHFRTIEHAWQSLKATDRKTFLRFTSTGDFSNFEPGFFAKTISPAKSKKNNVDLYTQAIKDFKTWAVDCLPGIMPKLASNPVYAKNLDLEGHMNYAREFLSPEEEQSIWLFLLKLKYTQNPEAKRILLATGNKLLVEFDKGAANPKRKSPPHWGGLVTNGGKGPLVGKNKMGTFLCQVRFIL
jgi:predicted NAD-dependent protein-ADP-ribosyltransferase YbiA (DUF1768 family)